MTIKYTRDGWTTQITKEDNGCIYEFQRQFTLTGAAQNLDLTIPFPFALKRIEYYSDDATAKSFTERVYSGGVDAASYDNLVTLTLDTNLPNAYAGDEDNVYTQSPILIRTAVSASTAAKLFTKKVIIKRLE